MMSLTGTTLHLIEAYAESESWKERHDRAMLCRDIEEVVAWGIHLFRGLSELEANTQARILAGRLTINDANIGEWEQAYRVWTTASEKILHEAGKLVEEGFSIDNLDEFRRLAEEARCQVELWDLESEIPRFEAMTPFVRPENPRPARYGN